MDYSVGDCDCEIVETSVEVKQNTNGSVQEKESTNASQSEQKGCIPITSQPEPKSGKALTSYFEQHKNTKRTTSRGKKYDNEEDDDERDVIDIEDIKISHGGLESIVQSNE
ncbi:hypothetical protein Lal_00036826 [Lupinus albus]|nr:hypothetical protein Lal_00036826 [Lupinus albus]